MSKQTQYEPLHNPWVFSGLMATSQSQAPRNMAVFMACSTWASPDLTDAILLSTWHNKGHSHHLAWKGLDWHIIYIFSTIHLKKGHICSIIVTQESNTLFNHKLELLKSYPKLYWNVWSRYPTYVTPMVGWIFRFQQRWKLEGFQY